MYPARSIFTMENAKETQKGGVVPSVSGRLDWITLRKTAVRESSVHGFELSTRIFIDREKREILWIPSKRGHAMQMDAPAYRFWKL